MSEYIKTIGDIAEIFDGPHATPKKTLTGPYFLSISSLENGYLDLTKSAHLSEEDFKNWTKRVTPKKGDILFSYETRLGEVALMPDDIKACLGRRMGLLRPNSEVVLSEYLLYAYLSPSFQQVIKANTITGATVNRIALTELPNFEVRIPPMEEQRKVSELLSNLDKKMKLNNQVNSELEAMAKTLYDYWFVQFDFPDVDGKPYKSSGGKMVYNETLEREIPEGWEQATLWDIAKYYNGLAMQKYRPTGNDYLPVIKIREMNNGISLDTEKASIDIPKAAIVNDGDLLFSWSATLDVKIWSQGKGALNQHIFKVTSDDYPQSFYYFELMNYLTHFKMMADMRKTTMGHITLEHLKQANIVLPPIDLIKKLDEKLRSIFEHSLVLKKENNSLVELRDWLLPMLMNGQVTVKQ